MAETARPRQGLLDTSVVIDLDQLDPSKLPVEVAVSAVTMAELAAGPHAASDADERGRRQDRLQRAEAAFDPLPFDSEAARAYGRVYAAVAAAGRKARGAKSRRSAHRGNGLCFRTAAIHPQRCRLRSPRRPGRRRGGVTIPELCRAPMRRSESVGRWLAVTQLRSPSLDRHCRAARGTENPRTNSCHQPRNHGQTEIPGANFSCLV